MDNRELPRDVGKDGESEDRDVMTSTSDLNKKSHPFINVVCAMSQSTEEVFTKQHFCSILNRQKVTTMKCQPEHLKMWV